MEINISGNMYFQIRGYETGEKIKGWKKREAILKYIKNNSGCGAVW